MTRGARPPRAADASAPRAPRPSGLDRFCERHAPWLLAGAIAVFVALHAAHVWLKYRYYLYSDIDCAMFAQAVDGILRGSTFSSIRGMHWLGDHSSLVLYLVAPVAAFVRHPALLPMLQTVALGLGAWPVWALARRELGGGAAPVAFALAWLLYPAIGYLDLYEFHPETLATPLLVAAFLGVRAGRLRGAAIAAAIALATKEDVALPVAALALYAALDRAQPRRFAFAAWLAGPALVSIAVSFLILKPVLGAGEVDYGRMYSQWGSSPGGVLVGLVTHPLDALTAMVATPAYPFDTTLKLQFYAHLLLPLAFLPLLAPATLAIALPTLATHMLSWRSPQHTIYYQYTALIAPFTVAAAVLGLARLRRWTAGRGARLAAAALLAASLASQWMFGALGGHGVLQLVGAEEAIAPGGFDRATTRYRDAMLATLGRRDQVVAGFEFLLRLADRDVRSFHNVVDGLKTFSQAPYASPTGITALIADVSHTRLRPHADPGTAARCARLRAENRLGLVAAAGDLMLFLRDAPDSVALWQDGEQPLPNPHRVVFDRQLAFLGNALLATSVAPGGLLPMDTYWRRVAPTDSLYVIRLAAYDASGHAVFAHMRDLGYMLHPASTWRDTTMMRERYALIVPDDAPPGTYMLGMTVGRRSDLDQVLSETDDPIIRAQNGVVELGRFTVTAGTGGADPR
ncbi:MAG: DUF2079 domain-containing protein [Candidatus Eisenbacteria bacterium]|nr:DUF2079 domain-containing protein [Candidatus Eisenbacteria bacterium]